MFAQDTWIVKITGENGKEIKIYELEVVQFIENITLFQQLFPSPLTLKKPLTKDTLNFKSEIKEKLKNQQLKRDLIDEYVNAMLFVIKAEELNLYSSKKLDEKVKEFNFLMELQIISKLYIIKQLIPKTTPTQEEIDAMFDKLSQELGKMVTKDELFKLAKDYATEEKAVKTLKEKIDKIRDKKRIKIDSANPFVVLIDGNQEFTAQEVENIFKGYLNLLFYVYNGGMGSDEELEKLYKDDSTKKDFVKEFINYHIVRQLVKEEGVYDEKLVKELSKMCSDYFKINYINIRYAKEKVLPEVKKRMTEENIKAMVARLKSEPSLDGKSEEYIRDYAEKMLFQQLVILFKQQEIETLRDEYSIEYNF
jgi:hypothetical protein